MRASLNGVIVQEQQQQQQQAKADVDGG